MFPVRPTLQKLRRDQTGDPVFHGLADLIANLAPEAAVVVIVRIVFRLITHAINDEERWRRLMSVLAPLLAVVAAWWLIGDGGLQLVLHQFTPTAASHR
jgi:hypothetical protein